MTHFSLHDALPISNYEQTCIYSIAEIKTARNAAALPSGLCGLPASGAAQHRPPARSNPLGLVDAAQERASAVALRIAEDFFRQAFFVHGAVAQEAHLGRHLAGEAHFVGDRKSTRLNSSH